MYEAFLIFYMSEESEVLFLCLLPIRKGMYLIFRGDERRGVLRPEVK